MTKPIVETVQATGLPSKRRWGVAFVLACLLVSGFFDRISIAVLFTNADFYNSLGVGYDTTKLGLLMTVFFITYALSALSLGVLGDFFSPNRALGFAAGIWGVLMICMGMVSSFTAMLALRVVLGIFEGPQFPLLSKVIYRWFPPSERGRANALWMMGSPVGSAIGFPLTIWLVSSYGWRASFYALGLISLLIVMPLVFWVVREPRTAVEFYKEIGGAKPSNQLRKEKPNLKIVFSDYRVWLLTAFGCGSMTFLWGLNGWLPAYLEKTRHFNLHQMGFYSSLPFILMLLGVFLGGVLSDRTGKDAAICFVGLLSAGVLLFLGTVTEDARLSAVLIALAGGVWGMCNPAQFALAMRIIPSSTIAGGIGIVNGIGNLVGALAPLMVGYIAARSGSMEIGLLVMVVAAVVGAVLVLPLMRQRGGVPA